MGDRGDRFRFRSDRGRPELNPYVDRIAEYAPWAMTAEQGEEQRGRWRELLARPADAPLLLEIGPGNGFFFRELCRRHPEAVVVGVEIRFKRVWLTTRKARQQGLDSFRVVHHHASYLEDLFEPGELTAVHVNHPDPWPKDRHHKNRLLTPAFRERLGRLLVPGGEFWLKSDFTEYGPLVRELMHAEGWEALVFTADLHSDEAEALRTAQPTSSRWWEADIVTNYERKSLEQGRRILLAGYRRLPIT
jgi:tRNA (guanine-N7-)-methyltransferase